MGPGEIIAIVIVAFFIILAVALLIRNRKKGKKSCGCSGCSGDCVGCAYKDDIVCNGCARKIGPNATEEKPKKD